MSILTSNQANSGDPVTVQINKNEIKNIPKVSSDAVFSVDSNWKFVTAVFKHDSSKRRLYTVLKDFNGTESMALKPLMVGGDNFQLSKILISKQDRSFLSVSRSEIPNYANYDFILKTAGGNSLSWTPLMDYTPELDGGLTSTNSNSSTAAIIYDDNAIDTSQDFEITYNFNSTNSPSNSGLVQASFIGYSNFEKSSFSGLYSDAVFSNRQKILTNNAPAIGSPDENIVSAGTHVFKITKTGTSLIFTFDNAVLVTVSANVLPPLIKPAVRLMGYVAITSASK